MRAFHAEADLSIEKLKLQLASAQEQFAQLAAYVNGAAKTSVSDPQAFFAMLLTFARDLDSAHRDNLAADEQVSALPVADCPGLAARHQSCPVDSSGAPRASATNCSPPVPACFNTSEVAFQASPCTAFCFLLVSEGLSICGAEPQKGKEDCGGQGRRSPGRLGEAARPHAEPGEGVPAPEARRPPGAAHRQGLWLYARPHGSFDRLPRRQITDAYAHISSQTLNHFCFPRCLESRK